MLFIRHGGTIIRVEDVKGSYRVDKGGTVAGARELTQFDRTGNTYGMEARVYVGSNKKTTEDFVWLGKVP